jgi:hypothetical protein
MESKGRRVARAAGPSATPEEVSSQSETAPEPPKPAEALAEEFTPADPPAEVAIPAVAAIAPPSAEAPAAAAQVSSSPGSSSPGSSSPGSSSPGSSSPGSSSDDLADFGREAFAAIVQSQTAVARGLEALTAEMTGLAISGMDMAARTATGMLGVKTLSDAMEVNAGFTRNSFDRLVGGSAKLSELGVKLATEASQPILTQLGRSWIKAARFAF